MEVIYELTFKKVIGLVLIFAGVVVLALFKIFNATIIVAGIASLVIGAVLAIDFKKHIDVTGPLDGNDMSDGD